MAIQRATDEANIRQRINRWVEALRAMDLEGVMSLYASDIVSFDIVPPLRHVGAKAKEKNWAHLLDEQILRMVNTNRLGTICTFRAGDCSCGPSSTRDWG